MTVEFQFASLAFVTIVAFGLNYRGRIQRCIHGEGDPLYDVEYVNEQAEIKRGEFHEDELRGAP
jgi:hypothetical protein